MTMVTTPWGAAWHLRAELTRILEALAAQLTRQRDRGRTAAADSLRGFVIEDGEPEGLIAELASELQEEETTARATDVGRASDLRREIAQRADAGAAHGPSLPLRHAERAFEMTPAEYDAFILATAVERDARFGRLVAYLNDHAGHTRPTLGLALTLTMEDAAAPAPIAFLDRPIVRDGLLEIEGEGPLPGLSLKLSRAMLQRIALSNPSPPEVFATFHPFESSLLDRLVFDDDLRRVLATWGTGTRRRQPVSDLIFAGTDGSGRTSAARAAAASAGLPLVAVDVSADTLQERLRVARRESRWHGAAVLLRVLDQASAPRIDWRTVWSDLADFRLPLFIAGPEGAAREAVAASPRPAVIVAIERPGVDVRLRLWQAALPDDARVDPAALAEIAGKFRFGPRAIALAVRRALADRSLAPPGSHPFSRESLERACCSVTAAAVGSLAQRLPLPYDLDDLVVPPEVAAELDLALAWVRQERKVLDQWGFRRRVALGCGLTALFSGPPGTGKTMAAQCLARELGLDLYRVDLSRIMSKYIGDTEKNLARLFDQAQSSVLFFDEADALFGKRSEVKDAHDRYANVEIGYLLQRMEEHDGVTVLASNRVRDLDEAFVRRFHVIVHFPMPSEPDRLRIWKGMFPHDALCQTDVDFPRLARDFELSGGEIKNAALAAAYLAADKGESIGMPHLTRAIRRELVKAGRVVERTR